MPRHTAAEAKTSKPLRVGIDFGMTIADLQDPAAAPFPLALETIRAIVGHFGAEQVFIISKAKSGTQLKILSWLTDHDFFAKTHMLPSRVHFVRDYSDKRILVDKFGVNFFIDDSIKVLKSLAGADTLQKAVYFRGNTRTFKELPKSFRNRVVVTHSWSQLYKLFSKPRTKSAIARDGA